MYKWITFIISIIAHEKSYRDTFLLILNRKRYIHFNNSNSYLMNYYLMNLTILNLIFIESGYKSFPSKRQEPDDEFSSKYN